MVVEMAMRFGMSPFAVAQCTSVIQGKMMLEGKLVAAALHASGALKTRLDYVYAGEGDARAVTVSARPDQDNTARHDDPRPGRENQQRAVDEATGSAARLFGSPQLGAPPRPRSDAGRLRAGGIR